MAEGPFTVAIGHWSEEVLIVVEDLFTVVIGHWSEKVLTVVEDPFTKAIGTCQIGLILYPGCSNANANTNSILMHYFFQIMLSND